MARDLHNKQGSAEQPPEITGMPTVDRRGFLQAAAAVASSTGLNSVPLAQIIAPMAEISSEQAYKLVPGLLSGFVENSQSNVRCDLPQGVQFTARFISYLAEVTDRESLNLSFQYNLSFLNVKQLPDWKELQSALSLRLKEASDLEKAIQTATGEDLLALSKNVEVKSLVDLSGSFHIQDYVPVYAEYGQFAKLSDEDKYDLSNDNVKRFVLERIESSKHELNKILTNFFQLSGFLKINPNSLVAQAFSNPDNFGGILEEAKNVGRSFRLKPSSRYVPDWHTPSHLVPSAKNLALSSASTNKRTIKFEDKATELLAKMNGSFVVVKDKRVVVLSKQKNELISCYGNMIVDLFNGNPNLATSTSTNSELTIFRFDLDKQKSSCEFQPVREPNSQLLSIVLSNLDNTDLGNLIVVVGNHSTTISDLDSRAPIDFEQVSLDEFRFGPNWDFLVLEDIVKRDINSLGLGNGIYSMQYNQTPETTQSLLRYKCASP